MIDLYFFKIDVSTFIFIVSTIVFLTAQLLLCFKVKCVWLRLIPVYLSGLATTLFFILTITTDGWEALSYLLLALLSAYLFAVCTLCWGIWAIVLLIRRRKRK